MKCGYKRWYIFIHCYRYKSNWI